MMSATVFVRNGDIYVSLRMAGEEIEEAGPFDDEIDAVHMAERSVYDGGTVAVTL